MQCFKIIKRSMWEVQVFYDKQHRAGGVFVAEYAF